MMKGLLLVAVFVAVSFAEPSYPPDYFLGECSADYLAKGYSTYDRTAEYKPTFTSTKICMKNSGYDVCSTVNGPVACNRYHSECQKVSWQWQDADMYPEARNIKVHPSECVSEGFVMTGDAQVLIIAQIIFSFVFLTAAVGITIFAVAAVAQTKMLVIIGALLLVIALILLFSYYYLNAIIVVGAACAALSMFRSKKPHMTALGVLALLLALYWTTFQNGLGNIQHHARFIGVNDNSGDKPTFENICLSFYRQYFRFADIMHQESDSPSLISWGFCARGWLAAELWFMLFIQMLLVLLVAAGAVNQLSSKVEEIPAELPS